MCKCVNVLLSPNFHVTLIDGLRVSIYCAAARLLADNRSLTVLELEGNQIGSAGASALAESLQANACLTTLALGANQIDDVGAIALGKSLKVFSSIFMSFQCVCV